MKYAKYLCAYMVPSVVLVSLYLKGWWSFTALIVLFVFIPIAELFWKGSEDNMSKVEEEVAIHDPLYDIILYGLVPIQYMVLAYFLTQITSHELANYEIIGMVSAMGIASGISINNAHELGHRNTWHEQFMSKSILLTSLYMHFFIEHNRGHHLNVATDEDPASSRIGENIYSFYIRTVIGSWISAWKLEEKRLKSINKSILSLHNGMIQYQCIQIAFLAIIAAAFGLTAMGLYIISSLIGCLLLETVNYIEHYGLRREKNGSRYERTLPIHSWNSNHPLGRMILLELSRHSDHHYRANRKYQVLRNFKESPQMPTGYPGMMVLALVPPLWFNVMNKRVAKI